MILKIKKESRGRNIFKIVEEAQRRLKRNEKTK